MFEQQTLYRLSCTSDSENLWELTAECFGLHKQTQNSKVQICSQHSLNIFAVTHSHSPLGGFFWRGGGFLCISWEQKDVYMTTTTTVTQLKLGAKQKSNFLLLLNHQLTSFWFRKCKKTSLLARDQQFKGLFPPQTPDARSQRTQFTTWVCDSMCDTADV